MESLKFTHWFSKGIFYICLNTCFSFQSVGILPEDRIEVQPGYLFGIHYNSVNGKGVIPYQVSVRDPCCGLLNSQLSRVQVTALGGDAQFPIGGTTALDIYPTTKLTAIKAYVAGMNYFLDYYQLAMSVK